MQRTEELFVDKLAADVLDLTTPTATYEQRMIYVNGRPYRLAVVGGLYADVMDVGALAVAGDLAVGGDVVIDGNLLVRQLKPLVQQAAVYENFETRGNTTLGDNPAADTVTFNSRITTSLVPLIGGPALEVGDVAARWQMGRFGTTGLRIIDVGDAAPLGIQVIANGGNLALGTTNNNGDVVVYCGPAGFPGSMYPANSALQSFGVAGARWRAVWTAGGGAGGGGIVYMGPAPANEFWEFDAAALGGAGRFHASRPIKAMAGLEIGEDAGEGYCIARGMPLRLEGEAGGIVLVPFDGTVYTREANALTFGTPNRTVPGAGQTLQLVAGDAFGGAPAVGGSVEIWAGDGIAGGAGGTVKIDPNAVGGIIAEFDHATRTITWGNNVAPPAGFVRVRKWGDMELHDGIVSVYDGVNVRFEVDPTGDIILNPASGFTTTVNGAGFGLKSGGAGDNTFFGLANVSGVLDGGYLYFERASPAGNNYGVLAVVDGTLYLQTTTNGDIILNPAGDIKLPKAGTQVIKSNDIAGVAHALHFDMPVVAGGAANAALDYQFKLDGVLEAGLLAETDGAASYRDAVWKIPHYSGDYGALWAAFTPPAPASLVDGAMCAVYNSNAGVLASRLYVYTNAGWHYVALT